MHHPLILLHNIFVLSFKQASGNTLSIAPVSRRVSTETCAPGVGIVHCQRGDAYDANGNALTVTSGDALTCAAACTRNNEVMCCSESDACTGFTGSVCMDQSCVGFQGELLAFIICSLLGWSMNPHDDD